MTFAQPEYFALMLVVVAMAGAGLWLTRWQVRARRAFAGPQSSRWQAASIWPRLTLVLLAASLMVVASARPQWGSRDQRNERQGIDLVIVLDVSQSMQAADIAPSRFAVAQDELTRLVTALRGGRFGLVFFAGSSVLRSPLSTDVAAINDIIRRADKETGLTRAGSDLGLGLTEAGRILEKSDASGKAVLLVSDGEDFGSGFTQAATALREKGIVVYSAGTGTPAGTGLFDTDPRNGQRRPKLDAQNRPIVTRLNEGNLSSMAQAGGGRYMQLNGTNHLTSLRDDLARLQQTPLGTVSETLPVERFQICVALAIVVLVTAWLLPSRVPLPSFGPLRRLRLRPGVAMLLLALTLGACGGEADDPVRLEILAANGLYEQGEFEQALTAYQNMLAKRPDVPQISYNAGNTLHRLQRYDRAVVETQRGLPPDNNKLGAITYYALGNHYLALEQFEPAYDAFKSSLLLDPNDEDAKWNLEIALGQLRRQNPDQQQNGQGGAGQTPQAQGNEGPTQQGQGQDQQPPQQPGQQPGEPGQGQPGQQPGQPQPGQPQQTPQQASAEAQRTLAEALKGLDQELSFEEAIKILDLLRRAQETQQARPSAPNTPSGPDY